MIRASASTQDLVQRLCEQAAQIAAAFDSSRAAQQQRPLSRHDWHSAGALWPDMFGENSDGK